MKSTKAMFITGIAKRHDRKVGFNKTTSKRLAQREANIARASKLVPKRAR